MEYTVNELALLSGVSVRTIHYYDQIDLLHPMRIAENGYRIYGPQEVDLLQQILFYRELEVPLKKIKEMLVAPDYDRKKELESQLAMITRRKEQMEQLIINIRRTIDALEGEISMSDEEKFEGFKKKMMEDNEAAYGEELRKRYGEDTIEASNAKLKAMSREQWKEAQVLEESVKETLKEALASGDPSGEIAQRACDMHRRWLCMFWKDGLYSKEAHKALVEGYVADERFTAYYENIAPGCTEFLRDAIEIYCGGELC